jgi:energy-coupling factor transporter ATP-binding protein EcfA2
MAENDAASLFVGSVEARSGAKVVVVNTLIGNLYTTETAAPRSSHDPNRLAAIRRIREEWIHGFLNNSLSEVAKIELCLQTREHAVDWGHNALIHFPNRPAAEFPNAANIGRIFDELGQCLLLLGDAGSGKTTLLLELARTLLDRAERDPAHRIPVIFNLSSWALKRKPLVVWMMAELNQRNDIPKRIAEQWVKSDSILPLLDGLDEVDGAHRLACLQAINDFRADHGLVPIVVCSRISEYEDVGTKFRMRNALLLLPLEPEQVDMALSASEDLNVLRKAVHEDAALREMLRTPLMLWIASLAYRNAAIHIQDAENSDQRRDRLFAAYVEAMFSRRGVSVPYRRDRTLQYLCWLAYTLKQANLTIFDLESINWRFLPRSIFRLSAIPVIFVGVTILYALFCVILAFLAYAISGVLISALHPFLKLPQMTWGEQWEAVYIVGGIDVALLAPLGGLIATAIDLKPAESIQFSVHGLAKRANSALLLASISALATYGHSIATDGSEHFRTLLSVWIGLLCGALRLFLTENAQLRTKCNQGTHRSAMVAAAAAMLCIVIGLFVSIREGLHYWLFLASVLAGLGGALFVMRHYVVRSFLWVSGMAPFRYGRFLDYATDRIFLRKVGGGYVFTHRMLLDFFASNSQPPRGLSREVRNANANARAICDEID